MRVYVGVGALFGFVVTGVGAAIFYLSNFSVHEDYAFIAILMSALYGAACGFIIGSLVGLLVGRIVEQHGWTRGKAIIVALIGGVAAVIGYLTVGTFPLSPVPRPAVGSVLVVFVLGSIVVLMQAQHNRKRMTVTNRSRS